jgi:Cell wall hydrolyses involved in spore germination
MKFGKWKRMILTIVLVFLMAIPVQASNSSEQIADAQDQKSQAEEDLEAAEQAMIELENTKADLEIYLSDLNTQLTDLNASLYELEIQAREKEAEILQTQTELDTAKEIEAKQYEDMKKRIQFMYENSNTAYISLLLAAESFSDFLNRADNVAQISSYDRDMLQEYQTTQNLIVEKETLLAQEQQAILTLQTQAEEKKVEISILFASTSADINTYATHIADKENEIFGYEYEVTSYQMLIDELIMQAEAEEEAARAYEEQVRLEAEQAIRDQQASANQPPSQEPSGNAPETQPNPSPGTGFPEASAGDLELLAAIIHCEAVGEGYEGQVAVGAVVMNRVKSPLFPNTISGVIYQPYQFSPVASGRLALVLAQGADPSCVAAAQAVLNGANNIGDYLFFRVADGRPGYILGNHVFH